MKIVVTGATGFIGKRLLAYLTQVGHECVALVRDPKSASELAGRAVRWSAGEQQSEEGRAQVLEALRGAGAVVHLAGEPVGGGRWNRTRKERILRSRVEGTRALVELFSRLKGEDRPRVLVSASAIGFYGERGEESLTELASPGRGFLSDVVQAWEAEAIRAESLGVRVVRIRTGVVLGRGGGALEKMQPVILGSGRQWVSWIHLQDVVRFFEYAIGNPGLSGPVNLCAPAPIRYTEFVQSYARATGAFAVLRAPEVVLRAVLGEMASIVLDSCRVIPREAERSGFVFSFPKLDGALASIYPNTK